MAEDSPIKVGKNSSSKHVLPTHSVNNLEKLAKAYFMPVSNLKVSKTPQKTQKTSQKP